MTTATAPILVVEDEADIREATASILEFRGFDVVEAENGQHAIELLHEGLCPCAILLDMMMPVMDGHAFLDALEGVDGPASRAPVIVVTAMMDPREPRACAVLRKPYSMDQFDRVVSEVCAQSATA